MPWHLMVVDGADANRFFVLPDSGTAVIGSSDKYADICLNDLYVARTHCEIEVDADHISLLALTADKDTLVNGRKIQHHVRMPGEVMRVGNSHLKLEAHGDDGGVEDAEVVDDAEVEELDEVEELAEVEEVGE